MSIRSSFQSSSPATWSSWTPQIAQGRRHTRCYRDGRREGLYLPPYSPDFNPIENAFAKLKALLRKAAERTVEGLWAKIAELLPAFSPSECANYFAAAGYDPT